MFCKFCGEQIDDQSKFCPFCGKSLVETVPGQNSYNQYNSSANGASMNRHAAGIICYITVIGLIITACLADKNDPYVKFHLNQALLLFLFSLLSAIPVLGWIWGIIMFIFWIMALVSAIGDRTDPIPLIGGIHLL